MLTYLKGDIFQSPAQVLVNTVNTVGAMGKGIALGFKNKYPEMFRYYQQLCDNKTLQIGNLFLWKESEKWILLFPTKEHWNNPSKIEYLEAGLDKFVKSYYRLGIESIAFPRLGCGNGKLLWTDVKPMMEKYLADLPINIYIYVDNYIEDNTETEKSDIIEQWIHNSITDIGFGMIKEDIIKRISNDSQIELQDGKKLNVEWKDNVIIITNGVQHTIDEMALCQLWNYIRDVGIFRKEFIPEQFREYSDEFLAILKKLEYLQPVIISNDGSQFDSAGNGYQYVGK